MWCVAPLEMNEGNSLGQGYNRPTSCSVEKAPHATCNIFFNPAGSIAEYFQKFVKEPKINLRTEDKPHEIQPNEHGSFKIRQKLRANAAKWRRASIREAQHM